MIASYVTLCKEKGYENYAACDRYLKSFKGISIKKLNNTIAKYFAKYIKFKPTVGVVNPWNGNKIVVSLYDVYDKDKTKRNLIFECTIEFDGLFNIDNVVFSNFKSDIFTEKYLNSILPDIKTTTFNRHAISAGLNPQSNDNIVILDAYSNYNKTNKTSESKGTIFEIFDNYTTANDSLKYCNGSYWRFADPKIAKLYSEFIANYNGNFFLDNAVRRGCIID